MLVSLVTLPPPAWRGADEGEGMTQREPEGDGFGRGPVPPQSARNGDDAGLHDAVTAGSDNIVKISAALRQSSVRDWMLVHNHEVPPVDLDVVKVPAVQGVRMRAVYDERFAQDPAGLRLIGERAAMGEEARLCRGVPFSFRLADSRFALLLPLSGEVALLVADQPGPQVYRQRFESLWDVGTPVSASSGTPDAFRSSPWLN